MTYYESKKLDFRLSVSVKRHKDSVLTTLTMGIRTRHGAPHGNREAEQWGVRMFQVSEKHEGDLVKISELARRSDTPASTIKYYIKQGLLPEPPVRRRNMALYDPAIIPKILAIKEIQRTRHLPLEKIGAVLAGEPDIDSEITAASAIARVLSQSTSREKRTRDQLVEAGMPPEQLSWLKRSGLVEPLADEDEETYGGDDLNVLQVLGASRRAGITPEMLPMDILQTYLAAIRELVRAELQMFRKGVIPLAGEQVGELTEVATSLSEQLVVLIRRKMLLPTLRQLIADSVKGDAS